MRRAALAFLLVAAAAVAALAILGASERRSLAFTLGAPSLVVAATLQPGQEVCQQPVAVPAAFDAVQLHLGTFDAPGPRLAVTIRRAPAGVIAARGVLPAGSADNARSLVRVGHVGTGGNIAICLRDLGPRKVAIYGAPDVAAPASAALIRGFPTGNDLDLVMRTTHPRSTLALLGDVLRRASLFRGSWIGAWLYWLLLAGIVVGVPALIARALHAASDEG